MGIAIQKMFDGIASRYDFLNHFLSAGRDRAWRRKAAAFAADGETSLVLDLCGGTGDFWKAWADRHIEAKALRMGRSEPAISTGFQPPRGIIADFSMSMLLEARRKFHATDSENRGGKNSKDGPVPYLVRMDALKPCFRESVFDAVLCGYGMRNLDSLDSGIDQVSRLLKPGGKFITLEFFRPTTAFTRLFYNGIAPLCIPFLGWFFSSRRQAYAYLVDSIRGFKSAGEYGACFRPRGFKEVSILPCDFGISHIVTAVKG